MTTIGVREQVATSMRPVHPPTAGLCAQLAVLTALVAGAGLGLAGWLAGAGFAMASWALLSRALQQPEVRGWGPADTVTLARATLAGGVTALVVDFLVTGAVLVPVLAGIAAVALLLDAVDGQVARRTGTCSRLGAKFDMETDSVLVLVLSVYVATQLGAWVLAIGAFRYVFGAAAWALPWLRSSLPARMSRKTVAAAQGIVLVVASAGVIPGPVMASLVAAALGGLCWSFGRDVRWLWSVRHRPVPVA